MPVETSKPGRYVYGKSPNPGSWHDTAHIIKRNSEAREIANRKKSPDLMRKLVEIESNMKGNK